MSEKVDLDYFYGVQAEQFTFFRIPKLLVTDARFKGISNDAKILYSLLLDRMSLSMKSGWLDKQNRVFIIYTIKEISETLECSKDKAMNMLAELDGAKGIGLIEKVKRGLGLPDIIYVKNFATLGEQACSGKKETQSANQPKKKTTGKKKTYEKYPEVVDSRLMEMAGSQSQEVAETRLPKVAGIRPQEVAETRLPEVAKMPPQEVAKTPPQRWQKTDPNNNYLNNNKYNNLFSSVHSQRKDRMEEEWNGYEEKGSDSSTPIVLTGREKKTFLVEGSQGVKNDIMSLKEKYVKYLKEQVEYDSLMQSDAYREKKKIIDGIINEIADMATTTPPDSIEWVNGRPYDHEVVKSHMLKIDNDSMIQIIENLSKNTTKITKKRSYLITTIYNCINLHDFDFNMDFQNSYYGAWRNE